jgi:two-component system sensor kinase FixL
MADDPVLAGIDRGLRQTGLVLFGIGVVFVGLLTTAVMEAFVLPAPGLIAVALATMGVVLCPLGAIMALRCRGALRRVRVAHVADVDRFARVVDSLVDPLLSIDGGGIVLTANPAAERVFGWRASELRGRNVSMLMGEPYRSEHDGYVRRYLETGERRAIGYTRKVLGRRRNGDEFPCELSVSEVRVGERRVFYGVVRDISDREELATRLAQAERLATVGELAAGIAHEINNPVNTIINCAQAVKEGDRDPGTVNDILQEGMRIAGIVRGILDFARDRRETPVLTDLGDVVRRTASLMEGRMQSSRIRLRLDLPADLPRARAVPQQVQQLLLNLLLNARDALVEAGRDAREIAVALVVPPGGGAVQLRVRDNGPGIPERDLERVFQPFFTTKRGGHGLGLAVCRRIAAEHGGRLWAESRPGEYAEFVFELPAEGAAAEAG